MRIRVFEWSAISSQTLESGDQLTVDKVHAVLETDSGSLWTERRNGDSGNLEGGTDDILVIDTKMHRQTYFAVQTVSVKQRTVIFSGFSYRRESGVLPNIEKFIIIVDY